MRIRKIIVALAAIFVPFLVFRVGSGLTEQQNVTLRDYTVSEDEKTLTLHAAVFPPIEDTDKAVYFNDADGFHLVLQKNELTGEWVRP